MPIRRPRGPKPALRHVAFLEGMEAARSDAARRADHASFLTLRLFDEWMLSGGLVADAAFLSHAETVKAIDAVSEDGETKTVLQRIAEAITMLHDPDAQPVLPRVFALGTLLEHRGRFAEAADVFATVCRFVDVRAHFDIAYDAFMRQAFNLRMVGELEQANRAYETAGMHAGRMRDRSRVLQSRIGEAKVQWAHGDLPGADAALGRIAEEALTLGDRHTHALALHDRAGVARHRGELPRAVRLAYDAFREMTDDHARERVLSDLGNFLGLTGAFETARAALTLLEASGRHQETRWTAQANLMDLAIREGSEPRFEQLRRNLDQAPLPNRNRISFLRDAGKGLAAFGRLDEAEASLRRGLEIAARVGMHQQEFEIEEMLRDLDALRREAQKTRLQPTEAPEDIAEQIDALLRAASAAGATR